MFDSAFWDTHLLHIRQREENSENNVPRSVLGDTSLSTQNCQESDKQHTVSRFHFVVFMQELEHKTTDGTVQRLACAF